MPAPRQLDLPRLALVMLAGAALCACSDGAPADPHAPSPPVTNGSAQTGPDAAERVTSRD